MSRLWLGHASPWRGRGAALGAVGALLAYAVLRLAVGGPFAGATALLLLACGLSLLPVVPAELRSPSLRVAVLPALALASFTTLLTTVSVVGVALTATSIPLAVAAFVALAVIVGGALGVAGDRSEARPGESRRHELLAFAALAGIVLYALASSWDVVYPFQARGTDWGHYLLYAEEVGSQEHLLIDDPLAGEEGRIFADPPAVGALYGSVLILDGMSSWSLVAGLVLVSALTVLSVYAAGGALWGAAAGLVASAAYAVAPIRLDPMYWHGLGTTLALVFVPVVVVALALLHRGERDRRVVVLLAAALVGVAAAHATSAVVVGVLVLLAPLVDLVWRLVAHRSALRDGLRVWWSEGVVRPVAAAVGLACVLGAGVIAHLRQQARELGEPVDYRFLGPDWLDRAALEGYYGLPFLVVAVVATTLVLGSARLRRDPALLAVASLALACVLVSQLWRIEIPYEYRRVVYYLGVALVLVVGVSFLRRRPPGVVWIACFVLAFAYVARDAVGLRLPQRVLRTEPRTAAVSGLQELRDRLDRGALPDGALVSDPCLHFAVPYLVRRPTLPAFGERQVGFVDRLPLARQAARVLEGGAEGARLAASLGVRYVVADPECEPGLAARIGGPVVLENEQLVVVRVPEPG